jgi:hypothetical protein
VTTDDDAADRRALQEMLTGVVEQLALLRQRVIQLGIDADGAPEHDPSVGEAPRGALLREIDAVEVLARGAQARASERG